MDSTLYPSPIGSLLLVADHQGIVRIHLPNLLPDDSENESRRAVTNIHLHSLTQELDSYFAGDLAKFETKLNPAGTVFQLQVWRILKKVPYGTTATYGEIARSIGNPNASRAVGLANNRNPIPIVIPCHRILGATGNMVGYAGEIWRKEWLLQHEGAPLPNLS